MIVSSRIADDAPQVNPPRRWVREEHTDHLGNVIPVAHYVEIGEDATAIMNARVTIINADLTATEIAINIGAVLASGSLAATSTNYSTAAQNFAALRLAYATATQLQAVMLGDFLSSLTSAQLQTAFNMTAAQVTTLRANKLTPAANAAATIRAAAGA